MDQTGNVILANIQRPGEAGTAVLQQNQQVMAKVLRVSGDSVLLSIQGLRVEARLTSLEQADALKNAVFAQFLVKGLTSQSVHLQLLRTDQNVLPPANQSIPLNMDGLAKAILQNLGVPLDEGNVLLAKAMLGRGMNLSADTLEELRQVLTQMGKWNEQDIQNLLNLKEAGYPFSLQILGLMAKGKPDLTNALIGLKAQLDGLLNQKPPIDANLASAAKNVLSQLDGFFIRWDGSSKSLQDGLQRLFEQIGNSVERQMSNLLLAGKGEIDAGSLQHLLINLRGLQESINQAGLDGLSKAIDQFIQQFKGVQFFNSHPGLNQNGEGWLNIDFPLVYQPRQSAVRKEAHAGIRITYHGGKNSKVGAADFTRLVLQVDLKEGEAIELDLSIVKEKMGIRVNASSEAVCSLAEEEFPSFQSALAEIGFEVAGKRFKVISPDKREAIPLPDQSHTERAGSALYAERYDMEA